MISLTILFFLLLSSVLLRLSFLLSLASTTENHSGSTGGVEVLKFYGFFFFFLEVTCDSNGGCHGGDVGLIWWVSMLVGLGCFVSVVPRRWF